MIRSRLVGLIFAVAVVVGGSQAVAILNCTDCGCSFSCSQSCVTDTGFSTCGAQGMPCIGDPSCGGNCLTASDPALKDLFRQQPARTAQGERDRGRIAARLTWRLAQQVEEGGLGEVYSSETGFLLAGSGKVQTPDLAFVSHERLEKAAGSRRAVRAVAPDLVAEILPVSFASSALKAKVDNWLAAGTRAVLVLDPAARTLTVYQGRSEVRTYGAGDSLELPDVLPGWSLRVGDLFQ